MEGEKVEHIYCSDRGNNDALIGMLANQKSNDPMATAAMMSGCCNGQNQQWNNPLRKF